MTNPFNWSAIRARLGIDDDDEDTTLTPATITAVANTIVDELHNKNKIPIEELRHHVLRMQDKSEDLYFTESRAIIKVYDDFFTAAMARLEKLYADRMRLQLILEDFEVLPTKEETELEMEWEVVTAEEVDEFLAVEAK